MAAKIDKMFEISRSGEARGSSLPLIPAKAGIQLKPAGRPE
jgi:hypothetical protein